MQHTLSVLVDGNPDNPRTLVFNSQAEKEKYIKLEFLNTSKEYFAYKTSMGNEIESTKIEFHKSRLAFAKKCGFTPISNGAKQWHRPQQAEQSLA